MGFSDQNVFISHAPMRATRLDPLILPYLITPTVLGKEYKLYNFSWCNILLIPQFYVPHVPNILFSNTPSPSGANPDAYHMGIGGSFPGDKAAGA